MSISKRTSISFAYATANTAPRYRLTPCIIAFSNAKRGWSWTRKLSISWDLMWSVTASAQTASECPVIREETVSTSAEAALSLNDRC